MKDMQKTPRGDRLHIALLGRRNVGKSSLINALTGQDLAIVSPVAGTTTDPIYKSMEMSPLGPVVFIDTAGLDDEGELGAQRVAKSLAVLDQADLALLVVDFRLDVGKTELDLIRDARERNLPLIGVANKVDLAPADITSLPGGLPWVEISAKTGQGISELKQIIVQQAPSHWTLSTIAGDLVPPGQTALLVTPVDDAAPKGRLILPQVQTIRDLLDHHCLVMVVQEQELQAALDQLSTPPALVITDSQAFRQVSATVPGEIPMTSFSILFARYKGDLAALVAGALVMDQLVPGDRVLIAEACTHHRQKDDIGTVRIPRLLRQRVGGDLNFTWCRGLDLPADLSSYRLMIHCGACMINRRAMLNRIDIAHQAGVPVVNYGVLLAHSLDILNRALAPFPAALALLQNNKANPKEESSG